jgi:GST-like protein
MIDFYAMGSPNVVKIFIALEETELAYRAHPLDVFGGAQFDPAFLRLNPNAKVPVIVDRDGPGGKPYTVFESGAILLYLAEKTGKLLPADLAGKYDAVQWLMVQLTGVGPMFGQLVHFTRFAPGDSSYARDRYRTQARRLLDVIEQRLAAVAYLGGAEYSIADIATFPWMRTVEALLGEAKEQYPHMVKWRDGIAARPAVVRALAEADKVRATLTTPDKAAPAIMDRVFGRGEYAAA